MLIVALFLVLFSNHMEERLQDGKSVPRVDCRMTNPPPPPLSSDTSLGDENKPLLPNREVRLLKPHPCHYPLMQGWIQKFCKGGGGGRFCPGPQLLTSN